RADGGFRRARGGGRLRSAALGRDRVRLPGYGGDRFAARGLHRSRPTRGVRPRVGSRRRASLARRRRALTSIRLEASTYTNERSPVSTWRASCSLAARVRPLLRVARTSTSS